jgi:poly(rC)-binding protein 2/3/4
MRNLTRANIRIISEDNLPKVAGEDDEMVQVNVYNVLCKKLF